eukprot:1000298_1
MSAANMTDPSIQQQTQTATSNTGIHKYRGICCKDKFEYPWLKNETCCFCCGVRCALLTLSIFMILDGIEEIGLSFFFLFGKHRSDIGCGLNMALGVSSILVGIIGYIAVKTNNEKLIRIYWYICFVGIFGTICTLGFAMIEFIISKNYVLAGVMACDTIFATLLWGYITYKVKRYYDLVFSHYHQLDDGVKQEQKQNNKQATQTVQA